MIKRQLTLVDYNRRRKRFGIKDGQKPLRIWSQGFRPFIMGGDVHRPMACEITSYSESFLLAKVSIRAAIRPDGVMVFLEPGGGIVGDQIAVLRRDLMKCSPKLAKEQMERSKKLNDYALLMPEEEFWKGMGVKPVDGFKSQKGKT